MKIKSLIFITGMSVIGVLIGDKLAKNKLDNMIYRDISSPANNDKSKEEA